MLVLSRRIGEEIVIGGNIRVRIIAVRGDQVRVGIMALDDVRVDRLEVRARRLAEAGALVQQAAADPSPVDWLS